MTGLFSLVKTTFPSASNIYELPDFKIGNSGNYVRAELILLAVPGTVAQFSVWIES
jgi:hypothetical protein